MWLTYPFTLFVGLVAGAVLHAWWRIVRREPRSPRAIAKPIDRNAPHLRVVRANERRSS